MLYTTAHLAAYLRWQGHDPDDIIRRVQAPASQVHDMAAWGAVREWYEAHPRQTAEDVAQLCGVCVAKVRKGFTLGRYYNSDAD